LVVCHVSVVDCPWSIVLGFAESEAVGAFGAGGGGGGGGAAFFAHAARNTIVLSVNTRMLHLTIVILIACFTGSSFLCAHIMACNLQLDDLQLDDRAHFRPAARSVLFNSSWRNSSLLPQRLKALS